MTDAWTFHARGTSSTNLAAFYDRGKGVLGTWAVRFGDMGARRREGAMKRPLRAAGPDQSHTLQPRRRRHPRWRCSVYLCGADELQAVIDAHGEAAGLALGRPRGHDEVAEGSARAVAAQVEGTGLVLGEGAERWRSLAQPRFGTSS